MYRVIAESGDPAGELISEHETIEQADRALLDAIEADAEDVMRYGIPYWNDAPTYAEALDFSAARFFVKWEPK